MPLPKWKNKKVIGLVKDEFGGKIMAKTCSYLMDDGCQVIKTKDTKSLP